MSTKTSLLASLNSFISAIGLVTKERHTNANELFVDEFYPTIFYEQSSGTTVLTTPLNLTYKLRFQKCGNKVSVNGQIQNFTDSVATSEEIFAINNADFRPIGIDAFDTLQTFAVSVNNADVENVNVIFRWTSEVEGGNGGLTASFFPPNTTIYINTFYFT